MRHSLDCVDTGSRPCVTLQEGAQSLRIALAAKASLQNRSVIEMNSHVM